MNKLAIITASLLISSSVFAATTTTEYNNTQFDAGTFSSKAAAYQAGFNYVDQIQNMSQEKLRFKLPVFGIRSDSHVVVDGTSVKLEEFAKTQGQIEYRPIVNVDYHYKAHQSN